MIQEVLAQLQPAHQTRFRGFLADPLEPAAELERELDQYVGLMKAIAPRVAGVNAPLVERLATSCRALLRLPGLSAEANTLINAAVRYFLRKEEDHDDSTAVLTFDDDIQIVNAVSRAVERPDLVVSTA